MLRTLSPRRLSSFGIAVLALMASTTTACSAPQEDEEVVAEDEQAITSEVAVPGDCMDLGAGATNPLTQVTPVTFRVQVYKTLLRVYVPKVSSGAEFEPLGLPFSGRDEYRTGDGPPSNPGIRTVNYRYWRLPHASASDPVIELALQDEPRVLSAGVPARVNSYQIVTRFDASTGNESLWISMTVENWYRGWGGPVVRTRLPYVVCQASIDKLPAP